MFAAVFHAIRCAGAVGPVTTGSHAWSTLRSAANGNGGGDRFETSAAPRRVLVVGAGPAGLEAARVAAERGHQVEIAEATGNLGGQFRLAGQQPRRAQILDLMDWYERQFEKLQVKLRLNTFMEAGDVRASNADVVILATGSLPDPQVRQRCCRRNRNCPDWKTARSGHLKRSCAARRSWAIR